MLLHHFAFVRVRKVYGTTHVSFDKETKIVNDEDVARFLADLQTLANLHPQRNVVVDMSNVLFFSAHSFVHLDALRRHLGKHEKTLELWNMPPHIFQICHIIRLATVFTIVDEPEQYCVPAHAA